MKTVNALGLLFLTTLTLSFALSCGVNDSKSASNLPLLRQNKAVEDLYGPLVGTYDCAITNTNHGPEEGKLIFMISSEAATNPDGTPGTRKVPTAIFQRINPVVADYRLTPSGYTRETGEISMTGGTKDEILYSIIGKISNRILTAVIQFSGGGKLGDLSCEWKRSSTTIDDSQYQRLLDSYKAIAGTYKGTIITHLEGKKNWPVTITLFVDETGGNLKMAGIFKRDDVPGGWLDLSLAVSYYPGDNPPQITMSGAGVRLYRMILQGSIQMGVMELDVSTQEGPYGTLQAVKTQNDEFKEYDKVSGVYQGTGKFHHKGPEVTFSLKLSTNRGTGSLDAQLIRSDKAQAGGRVVASDFDPNASKTAFHVSIDAGDGEMNEIKGKFGSNKLTVSISTETDGKIKTITLKKLTE
jgi:hypothetical protein